MRYKEIISESWPSLMEAPHPDAHFESYLECLYYGSDSIWVEMIHAHKANAGKNHSLALLRCVLRHNPSVKFLCGNQMDAAVPFAKLGVARMFKPADEAAVAFFTPDDDDDFGLLGGYIIKGVNGTPTPAPIPVKGDDAERIYKEMVAKYAIASSAHAFGARIKKDGSIEYSSPEDTAQWVADNIK